MTNCLLCGVGGQGTVLASRLIARAAMEHGLFVRTAETIGMAQRGGSVVSHVRIGADCASSLIPVGKADALVGFEPGEAVRRLSYLREGGLVVVSRTPVQPVMAALKDEVYCADEMLAFLRAHVARLVVLDTEAIAQQCGSTRVINVALIGALATSGVLPVDYNDMVCALKAQLAHTHLDMNLKALAIGASTKEELK